MLPFVVFVGATALGGALLLLVSNNARFLAPLGARLAVVAASILLVASPYVAYAAGAQSSELTEFYRAVWLMPILVLGGLGCATTFFAIARDHPSTT